MPIKEKHLVHYVPHGINSEKFKPLENTDKRVLDIKKKIFGEKEYDFIILFNSRNMWRKKAPNLMLAFRTFCENLPVDISNKCCLVMHTEAVADAGTDLVACKEALCNNHNVYINQLKFSPDDMAALYNIADVTVNMSSNEGFGLSIAESIMCGTPVIVNNTGGLQDQIGQTDENGDDIKFTAEFGTNSIGKYKTSGKWAKVVYPSVTTIQGTPPTPYIFDDYCKWEDVAEAIMYWYELGKIERENCGLEGRTWAMGAGNINAKHMCSEFVRAMDFTLENFKPSKKFRIYKLSEEDTSHKQPFNSIGIEIPKINIEKIRGEINAKAI